MRAGIKYGGERDENCKWVLSYQSPAIWEGVIFRQEKQFKREKLFNNFVTRRVFLSVNFERETSYTGIYFLIMFSESVEENMSSDSSNEDEKHFQELYFNQKSLNFKSEMEFLNLRFKTIGENIRKEKTKIGKNFHSDIVSHKFSIDNILGQLKSNQSESDTDVAKDEHFADYDMKFPLKSPNNDGK